MEVLSYCSLNGLPVLDPVDLSTWAAKNKVSDEPWRAKANSLTVTRGRDPSVGHFLVSWETLHSLLGAPGSNDPVEIELVVKGKTEADSLFAGANTLRYGRMYVHRAEAVLPAWGAKDSPYLIELRDAREVAKLSCLNEDFNLPLPNGLDGLQGHGFYVESTKHSGSSTDPGSTPKWTSEAMADYIWSKLPSVIGPKPTKSHGRDFQKLETWSSPVPVGWRFRGWSAWEAYNRLMDSLGHVLAPKGFEKSPDGTLSWSGQWLLISELMARSDWDEAFQEAKDAADKVLTDTAHSTTLTATRLPSEIKVIFPAYRYGYQDDTDPQVMSSVDAMHSKPTYEVTVDGSPFAIPGTVLSIIYPLQTIFDTSRVHDFAIQTPLDNRLFDELAALLAKQYLDRSGDSDVYDTYSGLHPLMPGPDIEHVRFFDFGKGWQTEVKNSWVGMKYVANWKPTHTLPDPIAAGLPYHRACYVKVTGAASGGGSTIARGKTGRGEIHWWHVPNENWTPCAPPKPVFFKNVGLSDMEVDADTWAYLEYWWQAKEWIAFCVFQGAP